MKDIIISFTSYPARINTVYLVIKSIQEQTVQADKILLWLSIEEFPNQRADLPQSLLSIKEGAQFKICWVNENIKSHKKYFYALQDFRDDIVITIDDDKCYESTMIETLLKSYKAHPTSISARNIHRIYTLYNKIAPYWTWSNITEECEKKDRMDLCAIGAGAVLYPPGCSKTNWFNKEQILFMAENQDDIWLKFQEVLSGIPVTYVKAQDDDKVIEGSQITSLMTTNIPQDNDLCIKRLYEFYKMEIAVQNWIKSLYRIEDITPYKKQVFIRKLISYKEYNLSIFGAGKNAKHLFLFINKYIPEIHITKFIVSDKKGNPRFICGIPVCQFDEVYESCTILINENRQLQKEIEPLMQASRNNKWITVDMGHIRKIYTLLQCLEECNLHDINYCSRI